MEGFLGHDGREVVGNGRAVRMPVAGPPLVRLVLPEDTAVAQQFGDVGPRPELRAARSAHRGRSARGVQPGRDGADTKALTGKPVDEAHALRLRLVDDEPFALDLQPG